MFIWTGVQKCQPFPTHSTPLSPRWDTHSGKINLIGSWPKNPLVSMVYIQIFQLCNGHDEYKVTIIALREDMSTQRSPKPERERHVHGPVVFSDRCLCAKDSTVTVHLKSEQSQSALQGPWYLVGSHQFNFIAGSSAQFSLHIHNAHKWYENTQYHPFYCSTEQSFCLFSKSSAARRWIFQHNLSGFEPSTTDFCVMGHVL